MPKQKRHIPPILLSDNMVEMAVPALLGGAVDWMTMVHVVTRLTLNPDRHDKMSLRQTTKFGPETRTLTHVHTHAHAPMRNDMPAAEAKVRTQAKAR